MYFRANSQVFRIKFSACVITYIMYQVAIYAASDNMHSVNQIFVLHASKIGRSSGSYIIFLPTKT